MTQRFLPILLFCIVAMGCNNPAHKPTKIAAPDNPAKLNDAPASPLPKPDSSITIAAVGDMMLGTTYPDSTNLPADSARQSFKHALQDLRDADVTFGNLEGVLLNTGAPAEFKLKFKSKPYLFKMPEYYGGVFKDAGFDIISTGNNHSNDFGLKGRRQTVKILDSLRLHHAGLKTHPSKIFTINGVKYGFCAFSPNSQTVSLLDIAGAKYLVGGLKQKVDIVIVSFHGGGEGVEFEHLSCTDERYKGERRGNVNAFAHAVIDSGADVVIGHGPHVSRAMELYKNRLIAYSLGNFCTHRSVSVAGICGLAPLLKIRLNKNGHFLDGRIISYMQTHESGLVPDPLNKAAARIGLLTRMDIDQPGLSISDTGKITPL